MKIRNQKNPADLSTLHNSYDEVVSGHLHSEPCDIGCSLEMQSYTCNHSESTITRFLLILLWRFLHNPICTTHKGGIEHPLTIAKDERSGNFL